MVSTSPLGFTPQSDNPADTRLGVSSLDSPVGKLCAQGAGGGNAARPPTPAAPAVVREAAVSPDSKRADRHLSSDDDLGSNLLGGWGSAWAADGGAWPELCALWTPILVHSLCKK